MRMVLQRTGPALYGPTGELDLSDAQEFREPFHGWLENRAVRRVTDPHGALAACAESYAGREPNLGLHQQPAAEFEGIRQAVDLWKQIKCAVWLRYGDAGHLAEGGQAEIPIGF